jgi:hypothetical protein
LIRSPGGAGRDAGFHASFPSRAVKFRRPNRRGVGLRPFAGPANLPPGRAFRRPAITLTAKLS